MIQAPATFSFHDVREMKKADLFIHLNSVSFNNNNSNKNNSSNNRMTNVRLTNWSLKATQVLTFLGKQLRLRSG
jgi:hypothetical protein